MYLKRPSMRFQTVSTPLLNLVFSNIRHLLRNISYHGLEIVVGKLIVAPINSSTKPSEYRRNALQM